MIDYLRVAAAATGKFGVTDCATLVIGWLDAVTGRDGMSEWAGRYHDAESCQAFITDGGGYERIADDFLRKTYGVSRASAPADGNPVLARFAGTMAMGLRAPGGVVAMRLQCGVIMTRRAEVLAEWGQQCS